MTRVTIEPITSETDDVRHVAAHLRRADLVEVHALTSRPVDEALRISIDYAREAYIARLADGEAVAVLGAGYHAVGDVAVPWLVATDRIGEVTRPFMDLSRRFIAHLRGSHAWLENLVHADNAPSIRYLKALGFGFAPVQTLPNGAEYRRFMMEGARHVH